LAADITCIPMARGIPVAGGHHRLVQPVCAHSASLFNN